jgi:large subunit ribosomal protein L21
MEEAACTAYRGAMTYAIIETGGKQIRVEPGRFYDIERLAADENDQISIDRVLFVEDEGTVTIGRPFVEGATVDGTILRHFRDRKVIVYKMQPKKKTRKKQGHRQELTRLMINAINVSGSSSKSASKTESAPAAEATVAE